MADSSGSSKSKIIRTQQFNIRGHLLKWSDTAIQISNISMVSTANLPMPRFPIWALILIVIGLPMLAQISDSYSYRYYDDLMSVMPIVVCASLIGIGVIGLMNWLFAVKESSDGKYLHLFLNSGNMYSFVFYDQNFMKQVLQLFSNIFENGTTHETNFSINVSDSTIRENGAIIQVIAIGNPPLLPDWLDPAVRTDFPPPHTVRATFTAHGAPSMSDYLLPVCE